MTSVLLLAALIGVPLTRAADSPNRNESPTCKPQTQISAGTLLEEARQSAGRIHRAMAGFVCSERITRFKGNVGSKQSHKIDVITSLVSYSSDKELYADIRQNDRRRLSRIGAVRGAWSEGEYGTFLREAEAILSSRPVRFLSISNLDNQLAAAYAFDLSTEESPWDIQVSGKHYTLPFHGQLWVSVTGNILRIDRMSSHVPSETGISGVNWSVDFAQIEVEGKSCWLPAKAVYSVTYLNSGRHEWNTIAFSDYHRYGSEVVVHFQ